MTDHPRVGDVYLTRGEIAARVEELGTQISADYEGRDLLLVSVLRGAFIFVADLARQITIPHAIEFVALAGYGGGLGGRSAVRLIKDLDVPIDGRDVLIAEDVVDTGLTLNYLLHTLELRGPAALADLLAVGDVDPLLVPVGGREAAAVVDDYEIAVAAEPAGVDHRAARSCPVRDLSLIHI